MVLTDGIHLAADSLEELHRFARSIGIRRSWFHQHDRHPHYDLFTEDMRRKALAAGAQLVSSKEIVRMCKRAYENIENF